MKAPSKATGGEASLQKLNDAELHRLCARLERRVLSGRATLADYGRLAYAQRETERRSKAI